MVFTTTFRELPRRHGLLPLLLLAFILGCSSSKIPDLGEIYDRAASHHDPDRNPIIVIPGVLGSKLIEPDSGTVVWGAFGGGSANPKKPEDARLIALPMTPKPAFINMHDEVVPDGVLESVRIRMAGLPFELKAYFHILLTLGVNGGYRDETFDPGGVDYGSDHYTCFQFDYDWRLDNVQNARRLHDFILEKRAYVAEETRKRYGVEREIKFDLVSHSMGGLLTRYYLRYGTADLPEDGTMPVPDWSGSRYIDHAILVAPPNAGAVETVESFAHGRRFGPFTPRYEATLLATFPALFQLLPRSRHGLVVDAASGRPIEVLDPAAWERYGWGHHAPEQDEILASLLPEVADPAERRRIAGEYLAASLRRARQFQAALDFPATPPEGTSLHLVAGDSVPTPSRLEASPGGMVEIVAEGPGDGRVLRSSALLDERVGREWHPGVDSPIAWHQVTFLFEDHLGMTQSPIFADNVLYVLLESPRTRR